MVCTKISKGKTSNRRQRLGAEATDHINFRQIDTSLQGKGERVRRGHLQQQTQRRLGQHGMGAVVHEIIPCGELATA